MTYLRFLPIGSSKYSVLENNAPIATIEITPGGHIVVPHGELLDEQRRSIQAFIDETAEKTEWIGARPRPTEAPHMLC